METIMQDEKPSLMQRLILWREKNISEKHFILMLSFFVGILTALAALILKYLIHLIQNFLILRVPTTCIWYIR